MTTKYASLFILSIAFLTAAGASAGTISDIDQIPGSDFGIYGLIVGGNGSTSFQGTSDTFINGNVAIGYNATTGNVQFSGTPVNGNIAFAGTNTGCATGASCDGGTVSGTITNNSSSAANAVTDAVNLAATYVGIAGTSLTGTEICITTGCGTENLGTVHTGVGGVTEYVYNATTSYNPTLLTIDATASQYVIINLGAGSSSNTDLFPITLTGGITSDHVLLDVDTTGNLGGALNNKIVNADVIDNSGNVNVDALSIDGRLFCSTGSAFGNCQVVSNTTINSSVDTLTATPEPSTALLIAPLLVIGFFARRRQILAVSRQLSAFRLK